MLTWALPADAGTGTPPDDAALVERARSGDAQAMDALYRLHYRGVRRLVGDILPGTARADDAAQEAFVRAFARLGGLRDPARVRPWLFAIARRVALEALRSTRRDQRLEEQGAPSAAGFMADAPPSPEQAVRTRREVEALNWALPRLREERRTCLLLRVDHGLSHGEISDVLGWSVAKVKVELHRARHELRALMTRFPGGGA